MLKGGIVCSCVVAAALVDARPVSSATTQPSTTLPFAWDSTVGQVFPDLAARLNEACRGVTLEQLLQHRAGLPANGDWALLGLDPSTTKRCNVRSAIGRSSFRCTCAARGDADAVP
jgi:hypothetical protein